MKELDFKQPGKPYQLLDKVLGIINKTSPIYLAIEPFLPAIKSQDPIGSADALKALYGVVRGNPFRGI